MKIKKQTMVVQYDINNPHEFAEHHMKLCSVGWILIEVSSYMNILTAEYRLGINPDETEEDDRENVNF